MDWEILVAWLGLSVKPVFSHRYRDKNMFLLLFSYSFSRFAGSILIVVQRVVAVSGVGSDRVVSLGTIWRGR